MNKNRIAPNNWKRHRIFRFKFLTAMKIFVLLTCIGLSSAYANSSYSQTKMDVKVQSVGIEDLFKQIQNSSEYIFFYKDGILNKNRKVSLNLKNATLPQILDEVFHNTNLDYKIDDRQVVIRQKTITPLKETVVESAQLQRFTVSGTIADQQGLIMPGANVKEKGTNNGVVSDVNGNYTLEVSDRNAILQFSYIGYTLREINVNGQDRINVSLSEDATALEDVVVVGYGVQRKSDLTGSISQVKAADIENRTVTTAQQALQGKAAGIQVIQTSGAPGKNATVRIRGYSSNSASEPLYVVDGLRISDIGAIDPNNIESMEILKDAASAAIYGAEAGNGVVLITTKKGKQGNGKITYDYMYSVNELNKIPKIMNAQEYINYMTEGNIITENEISSLWDGTTDTRWTDVAFENSVMQRHNLGFQGGNDKGSYYVSLSHLNQNGIIKGDNDVYKRLTGMINADYKIKPWIKVGTTNVLEKWDTKAVSENSEYGSLLASVLTMDPLTPDVYDADKLPPFMQNLLNNNRVLLKNSQGQYYGLSQIFESEQAHPGIMRDNTVGNNGGSNILGTLFADITPIKNLTFTSKLGYRGSFNNSYTFAKVYYANAVTNRNDINVSRTSGNGIYYQWENFANYSFKVRDHNFTALLGTSYQHNENTSVNGSGNAITKDDPLYWDLGYLTPSATKTVGGGSNYSRQMSYFGRINYNYLDRYLFQASIRRDASDTSVLPYENRWGTFPAFSAGYVISEEEFFPEIKALSFLKLRASWGQNGSTGPLGGYAYRAAITSAGNYPYSDNIDYQIGSAPSRLSNPELKWETSEQLNFGLDLRAFRNRLSMSFDYYEKKTKDLLVGITPPYETGVSSTTVNAGNVSNKGLELELGWADQINDFSYGIRGNIATLKNKVTFLDPSISRISGASYHTNQGITAFEEGLPVWYFRGYQVEDIDNATGNPIFRDQLTIDSDKDGINDQADGLINDGDKVMIGSAIPDFTYGITLSAAYKGLDLTVFGAGSQGNDIYNALTRTDRPRGNKLSVFYDDRWTPTNQDTQFPRPNANGEDKYWISDAAIFDGSFFKIKQIQIGYSLPQKFSKGFLSNSRIYISLDDWFTFTKYPGMDPEASAGSTSALGVDKGSYPISRKAVVGINLTF